MPSGPLRRPAPASSLLTTGIAVFALLGGCGLLSDDAPSPAPSGTPSASVEETATPDTATAPSLDEVRAGDDAALAAGTTVTSGALELVVGLPPDRVRTTEQDDGSVDVEIDVSGTEWFPLEVRTPADATLEAHVDRSVTVRGTDGSTVLGGLGPVSGGRLQVDDETPARVGVRSGPDREVLTTTLGTEALVSTDWGDREGGRSIAVDPTGWARHAGEAGLVAIEAALHEAEPETDSATMRDQLRCHALGAKDKATWNLEPWRPDVGLLAVIAARCNPT